MTDKNRSGRWKPGESGNPKGKPPGSGELQKLRASIAAHVPSIVDKLVAAAEGGDVQAARLLLERVLPPMKAVEPTQKINLPTGRLSDQGRAVLVAVAEGVLAPGQGASLLGSIGTLARVVEVDELVDRVAALEQQHAKP